MYDRGGNTLNVYDRGGNTNIIYTQHNRSLPIESFVSHPLPQVRYNNDTTEQLQ